jgi:hypothetical protein
MGEYVRYEGDSAKIGTCEDLYYVTYDDLVTMIERGATKANGNLPPHEYLNGAFRFRFPFPDEDAMGVGRWDAEQFSRGLMVPVPKSLLSYNEHNEKWVGIRPEGEKYAYNINVKVTCPMSPDADPANYHTGATNQRYVQIVQQRPFEGALWLVLRCPYCGALWRVPPDEGREFAGWMRCHYGQNDVNGNYYREVANRIDDGYNRELS